MRPTIYTTARGTIILFWRGNKYRRNGSGGNKIRWRCTTHAKFHCKALIHTVEGTIVHYWDEHTTFRNNVRESITEVDNYNYFM